MAAQRAALVVDLGGTTAKVALVSQTRRIVQSDVIPTGRHSRPQTLIPKLAKALQALKQGARRRGFSVKGIAIGVPGLVDAKRGMVHYLVNMAGWREVPLRRLIERSLKLPVLVDNDVNLMAWGEYRWGVGRGTQSLLCLMLGTGVGGGIIIDGRLLRGRKFSSGEIGHIPVVENGLRCTCGGRGCLERYVGNQALIQAARARLRKYPTGQLKRLLRANQGKMTPVVIEDAARAGDRWARQLWRQAGERIGFALVSAVNLIHPDRVVIGGGISKAGNLLFPSIRATVRSRAMKGKSGPAHVAIVQTQWGQEAGLMGAAAAVLSPES